MSSIKHNSLCPSCWKAHKKNNWYIGSMDQRTSNTLECTYHPTMTNWRVIRTLNTLKVWSLEGGGWKHKMAPGITMTFDGGHVGRRTAEVILFDYEKPFLDLLVAEKYVKEHEDHPEVSRSLTITAKGDELIRSYLKSKEEKAKAKVAA